ncbi:amidohydrolase family protein [Corynebacterium propinquum]
MTNLKIFDSHIHVWDLEAQRLDWLRGVDSVLHRSFSFADLKQAYADVGKNGLAYVELAGAVHIEADVADPADEDARIKALLSREPLLQGFVTHSHLQKNMHVTPGAVGVREVLHNDDIARGRCLESSFTAGCRNLSSQAKVFDLCIRTPELADFHATYEDCANLRVVIDHCGNAQRLDDAFAANMRALAEYPNVYCKLSGLSYDSPTDAYQLLEFLGKIFGPQRLMFASNWPVIGLYSDLYTHISALREVFGDDPHVFSDTARDVYNLEGN